MPISTASPETLPTMADIEEADRRLDGRIVRTPLLESPLLNRRAGRRILVKPEGLQRTGSFKFRGASNKILGLAEADRARGVVAYSSGNHAQGVAAAAFLAGIPATIVMPDDAPAIKRANTEAWGATVRPYSRNSEDRAAIAQDIAEQQGATLVPPFDDPWVIAGQGTIGLEIHRDLAALEVAPELVVCCCGGGGLISGTALALSKQRPDLPVYAVEPDGFDDTARSLKSGQRETVAPGATSICDALLSPTPGVLTFALNAQLLAGALTVRDEEVLDAMKAAFLDLKLVVEPGGAVALAAILAGRIPAGTGPVVAVLSGGNVDPDLFRRALERPS